MSEIILSVVVPSYNSENYIEATLKTIAAGKNPKVEYLLIDGGSKDSTMSIVKRYEEHFSRIISEPDRGQSDAFNKGFSMAQGRYITWLNSDDLMNVSALPKVVKRLERANVPWLTANLAYIDEKGRVIRCCKSGRFETIPVKLGLLNVFGPSTFVSKKLFEEIGPFNLDFHYCMDAEYWWRIVSAGYKFKRISCYFWGLRLHKDAKTANVILTNEMPEGMKSESEEIRVRFYPGGSLKLRKIGIWLARIYRIISFSIPRAILDSYRHKGQPFDSIKS